MRVVALVVATGLVVWGAAGAAIRLRLGRRVDTVLATATVVTLQVVVSVLLAGLVIRRLSPGALFAISALVSGPIVWLTREDVSPRGVVQFARRFRSLFEVVRAHPWPAVLASCAGVEVVWRTVIGYAVLPYGWDALSYHLTTVATWVRAGRIEFVPYEIFSNAYPANGEVVTTWIAAFTHSSLGLTFVQLPFAVLGAIAVMSLARTLRVSRPGAIAAGSLFFLTPIVLAQTTSNYVDLAAAALVLTSVAFGVRAITASRDDDGTLRNRLLVLCGIAGGLAMGTKTTAAPYVMALAALLVVLEGRRGGRRRLPVALSALGPPVLLLGGFWYARSWVHYSNPVYPFRVDLGPVHFAGPTTTSAVLERAPAALGAITPLQPLRSWLQDVTRWRPFDASITYDERIGGFGAVWVLVELPLLAVMTWISARRRDAAFMALTILCVFGWLAQPISWWTRYSMPLLAPGILALVMAIERTTARASKALMVVSAALVVTTAGVSSVFLQTGSGDTISATALMRRALTPGLGNVERSADPTTLRWLDDVTPDEPIAVQIGTSFYFPVFGQDLSHPVIPIDAHSPRALVAAMHVSGSTVFAAAPNTDVDQWAAADPQHFHLLPEVAPTTAMRFTTLGRVYRFAG